MESLVSNEVYMWVVLPAFIFMARVVDVSIGTIRIIYVSRGLKALAAACGFFEVLIWLIAITQIMQNLCNFLMYITYAGGFATGNYVGILIENRLAVGHVVLRIITQKDATELIDHLREKDFGVTSLAARGISGSVRLVFTIIKRKDLNEAIEMVKKYNPGAFFSVEDIKMISNGVFSPLTKRSLASIRSEKIIK